MVRRAEDGVIRLDLNLMHLLLKSVDVHCVPVFLVLLSVPHDNGFLFGLLIGGYIHKNYRWFFAFLVLDRPIGKVKQNALKLEDFLLVFLFQDLVLRILELVHFTTGWVFPMLILQWHIKQILNIITHSFKGFVTCLWLDLREWLILRLKGFLACTSHVLLMLLHGLQPFLF